MNPLIEIENRAWLSRVTCGWKKPELDLAVVRPYWRDAHSPAIARRRGIYEYRHYALDPIHSELFTALPGIDFAGRPDQQLMWLSDVRYADAAGLDAFSASPSVAEKAQILADIEMIVGKSTTYRVLGENGQTLRDNSGNGAPQGPVSMPTFAVLFRQKGDEKSFRATLRAIARHWANAPSVQRVRLSLFEVPDMEAERASGYPVKTHPVEMQYQAWIDLAIQSESSAKALLTADAGMDYVAHIKSVHAYSVPAVYTFNYRGQPTMSGLRGYAAHAAIESMNARHHKNPALLEWMYGEIARGGVSA